jgi:hypothetical protein
MGFRSKIAAARCIFRSTETSFTFAASSRRLSDPLPGMTDDLVDEFYRPLVQPLGNLVVLCAQAEASLLDLVVALVGADERQAQSVLKRQDAKDQVLTLARDRSGLQGFNLLELLEGVENYWSDRDRRNRYYHDDWFVVPTGSGIPATRGLPLKKGSEVVFASPTAEEIWALAARFRDHEHLFSHVAYVVRRERNSAKGTP